MDQTAKDRGLLPDWFRPDAVDTVIVAFTDMYGRPMGKRMTYDFFMRHTVKSGMEVCNYLMTVDMAMDPLPGFKLASWEQGYGDFHVAPDLRTMRLLPWCGKTAIVLSDLCLESGEPVAESPRRVLARQVERLAARGIKARIGLELEFYLFNDSCAVAAQKDYRGLSDGSNCLIDYHILHTQRDEAVLRRIRNEMSAAGIVVESSKGEWGKGQHELNLLYSDPVDVADKQVVYKMGAKQIADQEGRALTFMAKWAADQAGSSCHVHTSLWDLEMKAPLFWDPQTKAGTKIFRQFLGGLLKYSRELTYFTAPTINSYKRFQSKSWAPTGIAWDYDNRTCGFRVVGHKNSFRIENRMPGADANPYLATAAVLAAGLRGIEEDLDCGNPCHKDAYEDATVQHLPANLAEAADLFDASRIARESFGNEVVDYYAHTARLEAKAYGQAVTDWERRRYFEQI
ncbi:MAG TPA: glutamine synthetase family protein [Candidatus Brocadiia bacterium]|nr:glutamine synthetase family protein [Candidatus Brocadiia bacterium]